MASEVELLEVFRLGAAAGVAEVAREVGDRLAAAWLPVSRFREVLALTDRSRRLQPSDRTLVYAGQAKSVPGDPVGALDDYAQALALVWCSCRPPAPPGGPAEPGRGAEQPGGRPHVLRT
jgi:hypothetical protein